MQELPKCFIATENGKLIGFACYDATAKGFFGPIGIDPDRKIHKMLEFCGSSRDVADPWYTDNFDETYRDVTEGCTALLEKLK